MTHICCFTVCRILSGFQDRAVFDKARYAWKYAAYRGVTGTPQFIVNGVGAAGYNTVDQWEEFISKLLATPY